MTEIYLIRHAQAEGNRFRIMQGHWDGGVTELGRRQIALLSDRLRDLGVEHRPLGAAVFRQPPL